MNILALSVSRKVQLIKSLKAVCKSSSRKLFCADASKESPALYFGDEFVILPKISSKFFLSSIIDYCKSNNITLILPTSDHDMVFLITIREELRKHDILILMSESTTIEDCLSKFKFAEICTDNGLPVPSVYKCFKDIEYPCVAKLNSSQASKGVFIIKNSEALNRLLNKHHFSELIVQEYIKAQEYTLDSFYGRNGELICSVPRKRLKVVDGESIISETEYVPELIHLAEQLSSVFKFWGHITIQVFFDGSNANLIEVNPRLGGASNLGLNAGLKSLEWMLCLIDKSYDQIQVGEIKYNLKMLRYSKDFFYET